MIEDLRPGPPNEARKAERDGDRNSFGAEGLLPLDKVAAAIVEPRWSDLAPSLVVALALHAAVALALVQEPAQSLGAGGVDLEAISVEIALMPATAIESRTTIAQSEAASAGALGQTDGAPATSAAAQEVVPADAKHEIEPNSVVAEPPSTLPQIALLEIKPDVAPPALEAAQPTPKDVVKEPETPRLDQAESPRERRVPMPVAAAPPSTGSVAVEAGGSAARGTTHNEHSARNAAVASPGMINTFSRRVVAALGRTRPIGIKAGAKGTVKIAFAVADGGGLEFVRVAGSSGVAVLDDAALAAVKRADFPAPPAGLSIQQRTYEVPYHFR